MFLQLKHFHGGSSYQTHGKRIGSLVGTMCAAAISASLVAQVAPTTTTEEETDAAVRWNAHRYYLKGTALPCRCENSSTSMIAPSVVAVEASSSSASARRNILEARCRNLKKRITASTSSVSLNSAYDVNWETPLGEGGFGAVYAAIHRRTGQKVACKKICKSCTDDIGFQREMEAFLHLRTNGGHPNICTLHENFDEDGDYYLIMDLISGGEMFDHLINNGPYSEADAARLMREVASALAFIHGIGCVHGDLKPENIMLSTPKTSDAVVKLIDFGSAQLESGSVPPSEGSTWAYAPPEVLDPDLSRDEETSARENGDDVNKMRPSLDMWSIGVILYMMLVGCHPFDLEGNASDEAIAQQVIQCDKAPPPLVNSEFTEHLSDSAIDVIQKLLSFDPKNRMTAIEMLEHPWVQGKTARMDVIEDSDKKLSKFRSIKSGLERRVMDILFNISGEKHAEDATKRTSLIERSFKTFDTLNQGFLSTKELHRQLKAGESPNETEDETLTLSSFEELLSENMRNRYFQKDHVIFQEGEEGNEMYFINSGFAEISTKDGFKMKLEQGDFVGEGALLSPDKIRSATVKCLTPVHAIAISREYFEKYLASSLPDVNLKMREADKARALNRTKMILRQQKELQPKEVSRGEHLYKVGDEANEVYIVESGSVDVRAEDVTVFTIHPGDIVGVPAVIASRPHATEAVCASDQCTVHVMNANEFHRILRESPALKKALYDVSYRREFQKAVVFHTRKPFPTDAEALKEVFDIVDEDKSGNIWLGEVRSMLKRLHRDVPEEEVQGIMESLDIDQSSKVCFEEFKQIFGMQGEK